MRRIAGIVLVFLLLFSLISCSTEPFTQVLSPVRKPRLADFVGVWESEDKSTFYRFTSSSQWFLYNDFAQVQDFGALDFDGEVFTVTNQDGEVSHLSLSEDGTLLTDVGNCYTHTDTSLSVSFPEEYQTLFTTWYESANLNGNTLLIENPDTWAISDPQGKTLATGHCFACAEDLCLYLFTDSDDTFYARFYQSDDTMFLLYDGDDMDDAVPFATAENSEERAIYFLDHEIHCDYELDSGFRLLRNGGAVYNDAHEYKRCSSNCRIDLVSDTILENGLREAVVVITYEFRRIDIPAISGTRIYNSVLFSQYDYYTGDLLYLDNSTGNDAIEGSWEVEHDDVTTSINATFSSEWDYLNTDDVFVRFVGTYRLTLPRDYDGFVFCLRPVYQSYSAQNSASQAPVAPTTVLEDLGDDADYAIFCRLTHFRGEKQGGEKE